MTSTNFINSLKASDISSWIFKDKVENKNSVQTTASGTCNGSHDQLVAGCRPDVADNEDCIDATNSSGLPTATCDVFNSTMVSTAATGEAKSDEINYDLMLR